MRPILFAPLITAAVVLCLGAPVAAVGFWRTRDSRKAAAASILFVAALIIADELILRAPRLELFSRLEWNWQGKLLEVCLALVAIAVLRMSKEEAAVTLPRPDWLRATLFATTAILVLPFIFFVAAHARETMTREGWLFQLTMPGLAEELLFRGVIQGLLNRGFGKRWRVFGTQVGWGWLITSVLFAAGHVVSANRQLALSFAFDEGCGPLIGGLIAGWLRESTASIWPVAVVHNISNVFIPGLTLLRLASTAKRLSASACIVGQPGK